MRYVVCLAMLMAILSGCANTGRNEGRAAGILDAVQDPARAHARALSGSDIAEMRRTGVALLIPISCWPDGCAP